MLAVRLDEVTILMCLNAIFFRVFSNKVLLTRRCCLHCADQALGLPCLPMDVLDAFRLFIFISISFDLHMVKNGFSRFLSRKVS